MLAAKNGILTLILILFTALIYTTFVKRKYVQGLVSLLAVAILIVGMMQYAPVTMQRIQNTIAVLGSDSSSLDKASVESTTARLFVWPVAVELIQENFFLGVGTGDVKDQLVKKYEAKNLEGPVKYRLNAHNQYLQSFVALGLLGFTSLAACLLMALFSSWKRSNLVYTAFLLIIIVNCLTESILEVQAGVVFYAFFNSLFMFRYAEE